jgi:hypothetical protein
LRSSAQSLLREFCGQSLAWCTAYNGGAFFAPGVARRLLNGIKESGAGRNGLAGDGADAGRRGRTACNLPRTVRLWRNECWGAVTAFCSHATAFGSYGAGRWRVGGAPILRRTRGKGRPERTLRSQRRGRRHARDLAVEAFGRRNRASPVGIEHV